MKNYIGYWNFGGNNQYQAVHKYGVQIRQTLKPNWFKRFFARLSSIYWVNEIKEIE